MSNEFEFNGTNSTPNGDFENTTFRSPYESKPVIETTSTPVQQAQTAPTFSQPIQSAADVAPTVAQPVQPAVDAVPIVPVEQPIHTESQYNAAQNTNFAQPYKPQAPVSPYASAYTPADFKPKKSHSKHLGLSVAAICASLIIAGGSFYAGAVYNANSVPAQSSTSASTSSGTSSSSTSSASVANGTTVNISQDNTQVSSTITEVVENVMPSMVAINTVTEETMTNPYGYFYKYFYGEDYNDTQTYESTASGSGIIIAQNDTELLIVTNNHVIDGADKIAVQFIDDESYDAVIKGTSADNDLAVIAVTISDISADTLSKIKVATLGSSNDLKLGEPAIAIGNSLGFGQSVTVGYISALGREVQISDRTMTLIQTDAAINPGNSGGALLNIKGEVIGINSAKYSDTSVEGTGYAIPISDAEPIITELMSDTHIAEADKPYLGIYGQEVPVTYQERFGWPAGIYVSQVMTGSPASLAGIESGDIITEFNGTAVDTMTALQEQLEKCAVGDKITLKIQRGSNNRMQEYNVTAVLISKGDAEDRG